jgi:hypothetical protein
MKHMFLRACLLLLFIPYRLSAQETNVGVLSLSVSVRDWGAKGDGVTDDSAAFQKAFERAAQASHAVVRIPSGTYRLERRVSVAIDSATVKGFAVHGEGQGVSVLCGANTNGVLRISDALCRAQISLRDLTVLATREGAGTALEVASPLRGVRNYRTLTVENVDIRGEGLPSRNYFDCGVMAIAQWRPLFDNVVFSGVSDPAAYNTNRNDRSVLYAAHVGFVADWCYAPTFQHCYSWSAHTGYRIVSEGLRDEGPEDGAFYRCTANGVRVGIDIRTPSIEPQLIIDACHINARDVGIRLGKRKFFQLTNNLMYGFDHDQASPYTDIELSDCYAGIITGNIFHAPTRDNLKPEPTVQRTMIRVGPTCRDLIISGNIFNAKGASVVAASGARDIDVRDNRCSNLQSRPPVVGK